MKKLHMMMEQNDSTLVLVERLEGITKLINEKFIENEKSHNTILAQTTKTNGRVTCLEDWKNRMIGALVIMNILVLPLVFVFLKKFI